MALLNQKQLTLKNGITIPPGSVIAFTTNFPARSLTMQINLYVWNTQASYADSSISPILEPCNEIIDYSFKKQLTEQDFTALTPLAVHQYVIDIIESWDESWEGKLTII